VGALICKLDITVRQLRGQLLIGQSALFENLLVVPDLRIGELPIAPLILTGSSGPTRTA